MDRRDGRVDGRRLPGREPPRTGPLPEQPDRAGVRRPADLEHRLGEPRHDVGRERHALDRDDVLHRLAVLVVGEHPELVADGGADEGADGVEQIGVGRGARWGGHARILLGTRCSPRAAVHGSPRSAASAACGGADAAGDRKNGDVTIVVRRAVGADAAALVRLWAAMYDDMG